MGPITILFGILFLALGLIGYLPHRTSLTALIPAAFGIVFLVLGLLARQDRLRPHVMHLAALLGLIAFIGGGVMTGRALAGGIERPLAFTMQLLMALASLLFVLLCIKSFVDARRRRRASNQGERPA
jgi:membrane-bound ClpP family serine protease